MGSGKSKEMVSNASNLVTDATSLIFDPAREAILNSVSVLDIWRDMSLRENDKAHHGTFVTGFLMFAISLTYCILVLTLNGGSDNTAVPTTTTALWTTTITTTTAPPPMTTTSTMISSSSVSATNVTTTTTASTSHTTYSSSSESTTTMTTTTTTTSAVAPVPEDSDSYVANPVTRAYVVVEVMICAVAQVIITSIGICTENAPMLALANLNAMAISGRLLLRVAFSPSWLCWLFVAMFLALTVCHIAMSFAAWRSGFSRYLAFAIGTDARVQRFYREYQLFFSLAIIDIETAAMAILTVYFFSGKRSIDDPHTAHHWLRDTSFAALFIIDLIMCGIMNRFIRREWRKLHLAYIAVFYLALPIALIVAAADEAFVGMYLPKSVSTGAWMTLATFVVARIAWALATAKCVDNFGEGMKEAFADERTIREFVGSHKPGGAGLFNRVMGAMARAVGAAPAADPKEMIADTGLGRDTAVANQWLLSPEEEEKRRAASQRKLEEDNRDRNRSSLQGGYGADD